MFVLNLNIKPKIIIVICLFLFKIMYTAWLNNLKNNNNINELVLTTVIIGKYTV